MINWFQSIVFLCENLKPKDNSALVSTTVGTYGFVHIHDLACQTAPEMSAGLASLSISSKQTFTGHTDLCTCMSGSVPELVVRPLECMQGLPFLPPEPTVTLVRDASTGVGGEGHLGQLSDFSTLDASGTFVQC